MSYHPDSAFLTLQERGYTVKMVMRTLNVCEATVYRRARILNIKYKKKTLKRLEASDVLQCHSLGLSLHETADALDTTDRGILCWSQRLGVTFPRRLHHRTCPCDKEAECKVYMKVTGHCLPECEKEILLFTGDNRNPETRKPNAKGVPERRLWSYQGGRVAMESFYDDTYQVP